MRRHKLRFVVARSVKPRLSEHETMSHKSSDLVASSPQTSRGLYHICAGTCRTQRGKGTRSALPTSDVLDIRAKMLLEDPDASASGGSEGGSHLHRHGLVGLCLSRTTPI